MSFRYFWYMLRRNTGNWLWVCSTRRTNPPRQMVRVYRDHLSDVLFSKREPANGREAITIV